MSTILITGATGNIGQEVIKALWADHTHHTIVAGVRNIAKAQAAWSAFPQLQFVNFDFEDPRTFEAALQGVELLFLLRPPHLANVDKHFQPLIDRLKPAGVRGVVFLSVQGVETSSMIPHHGIEQRLLKAGVEYIFLRPSYFMQNLTTTLLPDIHNHGKIILPAGRAKFNWVDVQDIGEVASLVLRRFSDFSNRSFDITGPENLNFEEVAQRMTDITQQPITYSNLNPWSFFALKKRQGMPAGMVLVMIMLHFLPRFAKEPNIAPAFRELTGKHPTALNTFLTREKHHFVRPNK
jgi:uncharacterized protein YbjT (DUF2867 family)